MNIGEEQPAIVIEPIEVPVPGVQTPAPPDPVRLPEPVKVPVRREKVPA